MQSPKPRRLRHYARKRWLAIFAGLTLLALAAPAQAGDDEDGDLLPDAWELAQGLDPADPADADADPDGDRLSHRDEFFAGTLPHSFTAVSQLSDWQLLDLFKGKAFVYFWEQSRPPHFFTADNANYDNRDDFSNNFNSIASTGFALMSYVVADERGWLGHERAYERIRTLLARAVALQDAALDRLGVPAGQQGNRHGYLYHFVDNEGFRAPNSEISTVDHAFLVAGALAAAEYYKGTEVETLARQLALNTDWDWLFDEGAGFLYQGWLEDANGTYEGGRTLDHWNRYSELLMLLFLAMGHPDQARAIPPSAWDALTFGTGRLFPFEFAHLTPGSGPSHFGFVGGMPNTLNAPGFMNSATELHYLHAGSLHNHQYSHLFADFRARPDRYGNDFFANSISATMVNRQFCLNLNAQAFPDGSGQAQPYDTYGPQRWGLMAGLASYGYAVLQPVVTGSDFSEGLIRHLTDSGTVVLSAAPGSAAFAPRQTSDYLRHLMDRFQVGEPGFDALIGRYGFRNAFNLGRTDTGQFGHFPGATIGLDLGPVVGSGENLQSGLVWKFTMRQGFVRAGLQAAGFSVDPVEPFILNFDDNPPAPHEDPNGGGQDPHSFGSGAFAFGSGSLAYVNIGDPFPEANFGPQQWARRISTVDNQDAGAFFLLNNHSVSRWDRLSFWVRGTAGNEAYSIGLKDRVLDRLGNPLQAVEAKLPIADYHPAGRITTEWTGVQIPLRDFAARGVRLTELDNLSLTSLSPAGGTIEIDDIAFLGDAFAPAAPQGLAATIDEGVVSLSWLPNPEPDVVGYRIYRSEDGGQTFQLLNPLLTVSTRFTDSAGQAAARYAISAVDYAEPQNESPRSEAVTPAFVHLRGVAQRADGSALPGIEVILTGRTSARRTLHLEVLTGADGRFAFQNLPPGAYRVRLRAKGFLFAHQDLDWPAMPGPLLFAAVREASATPVPGSLAIRGRVGNVPGAEVRLSGHPAAGRSLTLRVLAAADGTYVLEHLPPGTYRVTPKQRGVHFEPQRQTVVLTAVDASEVNFSPL